jgi:two-component system chemotaxis response regulator CheB
MNYHHYPREGLADPPATPAARTTPIRVLTVDDSALIRLTLNRHLSRFPDIQVVGQGHNGRELLSLVREVKPDVVVLDVEMPEMNGIEALDQLMRTYPLPVIMLSNLTSEGAEVTLQALEMGALDFVVKPQPGITMADTVEILSEKIRQAAQASLHTPVKKKSASLLAANDPGRQTPARLSSPLQATDTLVMVASSTGGPTALTNFLSSIPPDLPIGGVIVQHMPAGFTTILSERLDRTCHYRVIEASVGSQIRRGQFLVAPGGHHLIFDEKGVAKLSDAPSVNGVRPAADVTMKSLAPIYRSQILAVVLTGMGRDGFAGAQEIQRNGGAIIAQDKESAVVYGMPRHIVEANMAQLIGSPEMLGHFVAERVAL